MTFLLSSLWYAEVTSSAGRPFFLPLAEVEAAGNVLILENRMI
jgi:hypothetical protein